MRRFNEVKYDADTKTATIGTGLVGQDFYHWVHRVEWMFPRLIWDEVYAALEPHGVNVVGGRVSGVGVGGFVLGGGESKHAPNSCRSDLANCHKGYSWKTNQYGLAVDNVLAYELVLPRGDVVTVTEDSEPELFFGLKGGLNNFVRNNFLGAIKF
jgi:FAD/FMN-containing dehydrogenase